MNSPRYARLIGIAMLVFTLAGPAGAAETLQVAQPQALKPWVYCSLHVAQGGAAVVLSAVPVATRTPQRHSGLNTPRSAGAPVMLFAWPRPVRRPFWMKGVSTPLAVAFIDAAGRVFEVEWMQPNTTVYHWPAKPMRAALEAPPRLLHRAGIHEGVRLVAPDCPALPFSRSRRATG